MDIYSLLSMQQSNRIQTTRCMLCMTLYVDIILLYYVRHTYVQIQTSYILTNIYYLYILSCATRARVRRSCCRDDVALQCVCHISIISKVYVDHHMIVVYRIQSFFAAIYRSHAHAYSYTHHAATALLAQYIYIACHKNIILSYVVYILCNNMHVRSQA